MSFENGNGGVRQEAVKAVLKINRTYAVEPFIKFLQDESPEVRADAALALGEMGDARALSPLLQALGSDPDGQVQLSAAQALKKVKAESTLNLPRVKDPFKF
jgi:HEAT repeat protein